MPSAYELCDNARGRLGRPLAQRPSEDDTLREVLSHLRNFLNHLDNAGQVWDYRSTIIPVLSTIKTYQIPVSNFGRAWAVHTRDPSNPAHIVRRVEFFEAPNLSHNWSLPENVGGYVVNYDGSNHSATRVATYWQDGVPYISFHPTPQLSCEYELTYSTGDWTRNMALETIPILGQYHDLIEIRAARSLLPLTEWSNDKEDNRERRRELAMSLTADEALYVRQFEAAALVKNHGAGISWRVPR